MEVTKYVGGMRPVCVARAARTGGKTTNDRTDRTRVPGAPGGGARCRNQNATDNIQNLLSILLATQYYCLTVFLILRTFAHQNILLPMFFVLYSFLMPVGMTTAFTTSSISLGAVATASRSLQRVGDSCHFATSRASCQWV